jgi:membrane protease YdiL (CAAX protease family)
MKSILQSRNFLIAEFLLLCIGVPGVIIGFGYAHFMFAFLWSATAYCAIIYRAYFFKNWKTLWHWEAVNWTNMKPVLLRWVIACAAMIAFTMFYDPQQLFHIWHNNRSLIPWLMVLYPLISALPQEFIFCSFFFKRYERFFGGGTRMVVASAIVFAYAHVLFINPIAPTLGFLGGLLFAYTFRKTQSLALVTIEHGLYGNALFLIGLGWYFYTGNVPLH